MAKAHSMQEIGTKNEMTETDGHFPQRAEGVDRWKGYPFYIYISPFILSFTKKLGLTETISPKNTEFLSVRKTSLIAQLVKNLPALQETLVQFLGQEDPQEKE